MTLAIAYVHFCVAQDMSSTAAATTCNVEDNCSARGDCVDDSEGWYCVCDDGYATHPQPDDPTATDAVFCNYKQKDQQTAFLLAFFLGGFGAGRFYCELWLTAGLKIALTVGLGCCGSIGVLLCVGGEKENVAYMGYRCLISTAIFAWCLADWILFGTNKIVDGNGVELNPW